MLQGVPYHDGQLRTCRNAHEQETISLIGLKRDQYNGKFKAPRPSRKTLQPLNKCIDMRNFGKFCRTDKVEVRNVSSGTKQILKRGGKPGSEYWFLDPWGSPSRGTYVVSGRCPCITAARGSQGGYWLTWLHRMTELKELSMLMDFGFSDEHIELMSASKFGHALGNSVSVQVLSVLFASALDAFIF